jgi:hypothetical protein
MKTSILLKVFLVLPVILFVDYILMVLIGCATCLFGFGNDFYCGTYCIFGKIILGISAILYFLIILPDLKELFNKIKNGTTAEEQKNL